MDYIIRRIDDLGRIVIPREVRRRLAIAANEPMEISVSEDNAIILRKHQANKEATEVLTSAFSQVRDDPYLNQDKKDKILDMLRKAIKDLREEGKEMKVS